MRRRKPKRSAALLQPQGISDWHSRIAARHSPFAPHIRSRPIRAHHITSHAARRTNGYPSTRAALSASVSRAAFGQRRAAQPIEAQPIEHVEDRTQGTAQRVISATRTLARCPQRSITLSCFPAPTSGCTAESGNSSVSALLHSYSRSSPLLAFPHFSSPPQLPRFLSVRSRRLSALITTAQLSSAAACARATRI